MSPMKLFEYMASGIPIIASDLPSVRDVLNEQNSILYPADSLDGLIERIERLTGDRELLRRIGHQAKKDVEKYTWSKRAGRILSYLNHDVKN
jgi:glycosyltransferase involved in cell wall biosynthesis